MTQAIISHKTVWQKCLNSQHYGLHSHSVQHLILRSHSENIKYSFNDEVSMEKQLLLVSCKSSLRRVAAAVLWMWRQYITMLPIKFWGYNNLQREITHLFKYHLDMRGYETTDGNRSTESSYRTKNSIEVSERTNTITHHRSHAVLPEEEWVWSWVFLWVE